MIRSQWVPPSVAPHPPERPRPARPPGSMIYDPAKKKHVTLFPGCGIHDCKNAFCAVEKHVPGWRGGARCGCRRMSRGVVSRGGRAQRRLPTTRSLVRTPSFVLCRRPRDHLGQQRPHLRRWAPARAQPGGGRGGPLSRPAASRGGPLATRPPAPRPSGGPALLPRLVAADPLHLHCLLRTRLCPQATATRVTSRPSAPTPLPPAASTPSPCPRAAGALRRRFGGPAARAAGRPARPASQSSAGSQSWRAADAVCRPRRAAPRRAAPRLAAAPPGPPPVAC